MCVRRLTAVLLMFGFVAAGCGWKPPSAPPPSPDKCTATDGPTADTVTSAVDGLSPAAGGAWREVGRGHTANCRLYWVQVSAGTDPAAPQHLLFFDRNTPIGTATPQPKPYTTVLNSGENTVTVQYQWQQGSDAPGRPTGIGQVRFQLGDDGKLKALDPIPN
ncbi:LppP/LprE family lipoprotein [Mycobacterium sp.]|uniref:LppP/LprE family lipoprotein n=1 Tax=Mycobacterium sp. TaxID=1785 RepID=UPI003C767599